MYFYDTAVSTQQAVQPPRSETVKVEQLPARENSYYDISDTSRTPTRQYTTIEGAQTLKTQPLKKGLAIAAVLLMLCATVLISSQDKLLVQGENMISRTAEKDISIGIGLITDNLINTYNGLEKTYILPMNDTPGNEPLKSGFSSYSDDEGIIHSVYEDPTITVDCYKRVVSTKGTVVANIAKIKIAHASQLRTAFGGGTYGKSRQKPTALAKINNAVVATNGDMYNYFFQGVIIRQGVLYYETPSTRGDVYSLFVDDNGDFIIMDSEEALSSGFYKDGSKTIYNSFFFGPALVLNGELIQYESGDKYTVASDFYRNPRTAIGQTGSLEYIMVMVEGRNEISNGFRMNELAQLMYDLGCVQAYNLDGGQSANMTFGDKLFSTPAGGNQRNVSEIIYFASAMPESE